MGIQTLLLMMAIKCTQSQIAFHLTEEFFDLSSLQIVAQHLGIQQFCLIGYQTVKLLEQLARPLAETTN